MVSRGSGDSTTAGATFTSISICRCEGGSNRWSDGNGLRGRSHRSCSISSVRFLFALPRLRARTGGGINSGAVITTGLAIAEKCHAVRNDVARSNDSTIPPTFPYADDTTYCQRRDLIFCQHVTVIDISFRITLTHDCDIISTVAGVGLDTE